jgi:WD40 repeat protein
MLVTMSGKEAKLWHTATGQLKQVLRGHRGEVRSVALSPDGESLATGGADGTVKLWNLKTGQPTATLPGYQAKKYPRWRIIARKFAELLTYTGLHFSPDGKKLLTVPRHQATKLWDSTTGRLEATLGEQNIDAKFSSGGRFVVTERDDLETADLWETGTAQLKATFAIPANDAAFSPDENWLGPVEYRAKKGLLNLKTMEVEIPLTSETWFTGWILFGPNSRFFVLSSGLYRHHAHLIDISNGKEIASLPIVARQGSDPVSDYLKYVERLSFHPSSQILMGANQKLVRFWDTKSGQQIREVAEARDPAAFSSDGKLLITASKDQKSILLWEVKI